MRTLSCLLSLLFSIASIGLAGQTEVFPAPYPGVREITKAGGWVQDEARTNGKCAHYMSWDYQDEEKYMQAADMNGDGAIDYLRHLKPVHSYNHTVWIDTDHDGFFDRGFDGDLKERIAVPTLPDLPGLPHGLVLIIDDQMARQPFGTIRVTIENRGSKPTKVIRPTDIQRPWGAGGWWYCGSYQFYLQSADKQLFTYACPEPQPPAAMPMPGPPDIVELQPGQSVGTLITLPLTRDVGGGESKDEPALPALSWHKVGEKDPSWPIASNNPPEKGSVIKVVYRPQFYPSRLLKQLLQNGQAVEESFSPPKNLVVISNTIAVAEMFKD